MNEKDSIENFTFESREVYDRAKKEMEVIKKIQNSSDLSNGKNALKVYNKAVSEKLFNTVVGYCFLNQLREIIIEDGLAVDETLLNIPIKENYPIAKDIIPKPSARTEKFKRLYEGQKILNKKFKIALAALIILLIGFVVINMRFEYSIFTYFTNYKANMEEELIDKYENWQSELEEKEKNLTQETVGDSVTGSAVNGQKK